MGTPHLGSNKADWARLITHLSNLLRKTNKEIVAVLRPGSEILANLQQEFHTMLEDRRRNEGNWIEIFCFYEELPYPGIGEVRTSVSMTSILHSPGLLNAAPAEAYQGFYAIQIYSL